MAAIPQGLAPDAIELFFAQAQAGELNAPPSAYWLITNACNLRCEFCFGAFGKRAPDELTTEEIKTILKDFARSGVASVGFLGGEPLLRRDIFEILDYTSDLGISPAIISNGTLLDRAKVRRLRSAGLEIFGTSIDGMSAATHDRLRGVAGALERTKRAVQWVVEERIRCNVRTVITAENADEVPALFEWALSVGVDEMILLSEFPLGRGAGQTRDENWAKAQTAKEVYTKTLNTLRQIARSDGIDVPPPFTYRHTGVLLSLTKTINVRSELAFYESAALRGFQVCRGCVIGRYFISPQANGDVYPCPFLPIRIGNLRTQRISEIWRQSELLQRVRKRDYSGPCGTCEINDVCGGCRARVYAITGDLYASDPLCPRVTAGLVGAMESPVEQSVRCALV